MTVRKPWRPCPKITLTRNLRTGWWQYEFTEGVWYIGSYPTKRYTRAMAKKTRDHYDPYGLRPRSPQGPSMFFLREKCRNCGLPLHWVDGVGWLHGLASSSWCSKSVDCETAEPWCPFDDCEHGDQDPPNACGCRCHPRPRLPGRKRRTRRTD